MGRHIRAGRWSATGHTRDHLLYDIAFYASVADASDLPDRIQVICGSPTAALESLALGYTAWITGILNVVPGPAKTLMSTSTKSYPSSMRWKRCATQQG